MEYKTLGGDYIPIKFLETEKIGITDTLKELVPIFYKPAFTIPIKNNFHGLLGLPFLLKYDEVIIDWANRRMYLN